MTRCAARVAGWALAITAALDAPSLAWQAGPVRTPPQSGATAGAAPPVAAAPVGPLVELPPQTLAPGQCALFLWERAPSARRLAMLSASPPFARVMTAEGLRDLAQTSGAGEPRFGLTPEASYADVDLSLSVTLRFEDTQGLVGGALARDGALSIGRPGADVLVIPVAGILGCL